LSRLRMHLAISRLKQRKKKNKTAPDPVFA
jgi:hypothetical protein